MGEHLRNSYCFLLVSLTMRERVGVFFIIVRFIAVVSVLHVILALWQLSFNPAVRFPFCLCLIRFVFVVRSCFSGEPEQN